MIADRLRKIPRYLFVELDSLRLEVEKKGVSVINLSVGDPDTATPPEVVEKLREAVSRQSNQNYPPSTGLSILRESIAAWMKKRFGVAVNPEKEVLVLLGSKEGIGHFPLAVLNPGDVALIPEPGYPVYATSTLFAAGIPESLPLRKENGFLPDFDSIDESVLRKTKLLFVNYPNNPTGAVCTPEFYEETVSLARKYGFVVASDAAYSEITFDGYSAPSILQSAGGKEVGIEFHSFSKTYSMAGWRVAFAVGNEELVRALAQVKSNLDSGLFKAVQLAAVEALSLGDGHADKLRETYRKRRDLVCGRLKRLGFDVTKPFGSLYVWTPVPGKHDSMSFAKELLNRAGVLVAPGSGFGSAGEGYFRISLTSSEEKLDEAFDRIEASGLFAG